MFSDDWANLLHTAGVGVLAYAALVVLLRASGKRTLSKWNAFDFIVTVALGSSLATVLLSGQVSLVRGLVGFALLILLQYLVTWSSVRIPALRRLVKAQPALLFAHGEFIHDAMTRERVTESEILAALRARGISDSTRVAAVVLETDGSFSVVRDEGPASKSTLVDVSRAGR